MQTNAAIEDLYSSTLGANLRESVTLQNRLVELQQQQTLGAQEQARIAAEQASTLGETLASSQTLLSILGQRNMGAGILLSIERNQLETLGATGEASRTLIAYQQQQTLGAGTLLSIERNRRDVTGEALGISRSLNTALQSGVAASSQIRRNLQLPPRIETEVVVTERRRIVYEDDPGDLDRLADRLTELQSDRRA